MAGVDEDTMWSRTGMSYTPCLILRVPVSPVIWSDASGWQNGLQEGAGWLGVVDSHPQLLLGVSLVEGSSVAKSKGGTRPLCGV